LGGNVGYELNMDFINVSDFLDSEMSGMSVVPLKALQTNREPYTSLLVQPTGHLMYSDESIGYVQSEVATRSFSDLFEKVECEKINLVASPEYSASWDFVRSISVDSNRPDSGNIWALGCESISPMELVSLKGELDSKGISVLYENLHQEDKNFLCPLLYVFWVKSNDGTEKLVALFQFKTTPLGGVEVERQNLYLGSRIYKFGNSQEEINFYTLVCADVFAMSDEMVQENHRDSLILHVQLNPKPWHSTFSKYRSHLFDVGSNSNVELCCLNWARGFSWENDGTSKHSPNSGFYFPKLKFERPVSDQDVDRLHSAGLYYSRPHDHWDSLFLGNSPQALKVRRSKIRHDGLQVLNPNSVCEVIQRFTHDDAMSDWFEEDDDDGFSDAVSETKPSSPAELRVFVDYEKDLNRLKHVSPLSLERCLELLRGPDGPAENWYCRYQMKATKMEEEESVRRVTVHQEYSADRKGYIFRNRRLITGLNAYMLRLESIDFPSQLSDLNSGFIFTWDPNHPNQNIQACDEQNLKATLVYLQDPTSDYPEAIKTKLSHAIRVCMSKKYGHMADFQNYVVQSLDRLLVVYFQYGGPKFLSGTTTDVSEPFKRSAVDIAGD